MLNQFATIIFDFSYRLLDQFSITIIDFSRNCHLSEIFHSIRNKLGIRPCLHPCDHDTTSIRSEHTLRSIEINSAVERLYILSYKFMGFFVVGSRQIDNAVSHMEFEVFRKHCHRTDHKDMFTVNFIEVRTFPHLAKSGIAVIQNRYIFPLESIRTFVKKNSAVSIICHIGDHSIKIAIVFLPDLRITEIYFTSAFRNIISGNDRIVFIFLIIDTITHSDTLCLMSRKLSVCHRSIAYEANSSVHQKMSSIRKLQSTSGKASKVIIGFFRCHNYRKSFPCKHIFAAEMSPVHWTPFIRIWMVLIKQMVFSIVIRKSVWIIDPACTTSHMKRRTFFRRNFAQLFLFKFSGLL